MIKYVGFDKDGTLLDSMSSYATAWGNFFNIEFGLDSKKSGDFLIQTAGQQTVEQVNSLLKKNDIILSDSEVFLTANKLLGYLGNIKVEAYPDVFPVLKELKSKGYSLFVSTGHKETVAKNDMKSAGLIDYIDLIEGERFEEPNFSKGKPHFEYAAKFFKVSFNEFIKQTVFVGDTQTDIEAANSVGIISIERESTNTREELLKMGTKHVVKDFTGLIPLIESLS